MQCPVCDVTLVISSREGIEIDYCAQCRGVWLDRGELDKIIERATPAMVSGPVGRGGPEADWDDRSRRDENYREERFRDERYRDDDWDEGRRYKKKRRGSFLEDIFDFD